MELEFSRKLVDDADNIAIMAHSAAPEIFNYFYDTPDASALDFIAYEYRSGRGMCGYKQMTLAITEEGEVVGTVSFYNLTDYMRMSLGTAVNILSFYGLVTGLRVIARTLHAPSALRTPGMKEMYLCNLGVKAGIRGAGIGSRLLTHQATIAREMGYPRMSLDVDTQNPNAQRLYERLGFKVVKANKKFSGNTRNPVLHNEMVKAL
ncbi:MAG: GNAT family N-acetyltransferase [Alcanivoracaceae bacterium]|nr:GNAT family N-acetyltransferase [Alcanivoracaceae bacterium]